MTHKYDKLSTLVLGALFVLVTFVLAPAPPEKKSSINSPTAKSPAVEPPTTADPSSTPIVTAVDHDQGHTTEKTIAQVCAEDATMEVEITEEALADAQCRDRDR